MRRYQRAFICKEIRRRRVNHKEKKNNLHMIRHRLTGFELYERLRKKRDYYAGYDYNHAYSPVRFAIELHKRLDFVLILLGDRFVQSINNGRTHT